MWVPLSNDSWNDAEAVPPSCNARRVFCFRCNDLPSVAAASVHTILKHFEVLPPSGLHSHSVRRRDVQTETHLEKVLSFHALQRSEVTIQTETCKKKKRPAYRHLLCAPDSSACTWGPMTSCLQRTSVLWWWRTDESAPSRSTRFTTSADTWLVSARVNVGVDRTRAATSQAVFVPRYRRGELSSPSPHWWFWVLCPHPDWPGRVQRWGETPDRC